ncbi:propionate catabolism operon regulatory protein PrpR [Pigmentiphaga aceris]|uniref:Propionate catabolism operon regulatory protein PrpR n=1 Tax=Pigmentiphaga aceris TaxID=1940612 RepID=A0A5C0B2B6_9BURK|nr:propionate catabolism operon regulatory protein PrpR [Pigmentiphaga aceris]QEI06737.1 propionate catabolism operon regulatory protein PrpR [Pigmentiphaga aceris]
MPVTAHQTSAQPAPRIVAVGFHRLKELLLDLAPSYRPAISVEVLDKGFVDAVDDLRAMQAAGVVDVVVAAGANGAFLRERLDLPVVLIKTSGFDVMRALARARQIASKIALVSYGGVSVEVEQFSARFGLNIEQHSYRTTEEAETCVRDMKLRGIEAVVAPGLVSDLAEAAGMHGLFVYTHDAVREAIDVAIEMSRIARIELAKRERLNIILGHLKDGVVAVDLDERIETLNPAMEAVLGAADTVIGRKLSDVAPSLSLQVTLREGRSDIEQITRINQRTLVATRTPIVEQGIHTGAVLVCQDPQAIQRADRRLRAKGQARSAQARYTLDDLVGSSTPMQHAKALALRCAASQATALIAGESGTGKELLAQGIHHAGPRAAQPFVAINCAAFPEALLESELFGFEEGAFTGSRRGGKAGLFETAHTGTIFLDEIGEMAPALQTRLLRVLQEREVLRLGATEPTPIDVRVIAATHRDLAARVETGEFRRDLYYRLNILSLQLPPLRERPEDLPEIGAHLVAKLCERLDIDATSVQPMLQRLAYAGQSYAWPGNVREFENLLERALAYRSQWDRASTAEIDLALREMTPELFAARRNATTQALAFEQQPANLQAPTNLPASTHAAPPPPMSTAKLSGRRENELRYILDVLAACGGDKALACERLGISRATLWRKLKAAG